MPTAFASREELADADLTPVRYPRPSLLSAPLRGRPKALEALASLGVETVGDLLGHLPYDRREARSVADLVPGETATVVVEVRSIAVRPVRRRGMRPLVEATVFDGTGPMKATFFNQPWLADKYKPGTRLALHGKFEGRNRFRVSAHAPTREATAGAGGVAHYPATQGITSTEIHSLVREHRDAVEHLVDPLPASVLATERLTDRPAATAAVHFPEADGDFEDGRRRLAFDELLLLQLALLVRRARRREGASAEALAGARELTARWLAGALPFVPTDDQMQAMGEVEEDLAAPRPMQRLLMGEVGSGKTVVALFALLRAVEHGVQGALMAPTETLAEQHFRTVQLLLGAENVTVALLTGSTPGARRAEILARLETGELSLVVGTHALIEEDVRFARLAVAVVDEQHRFGVRQRAALDAKGPGGMRPHVLHMTATPIPRTLALTAYGDLDVTALRELPRGRRPIATHVASSERARARAYDRLREELRAGRQAYVVCPLVAESEALQARAAEAEYERLRTGELSDFEVVLLHGQLRTREKQAAMAAFAEGRADVLVATTVIEVGIDVPNATVMLVEDADRYGISQLHQLRGRIGRGEHDSLCLLFGPSDSRRLGALAEHRDGFRLAEIDLELRGEGELIGVRQSGLQAFSVARLPEDADLLGRARALAGELLRADPLLAEAEHALLGEALRAVHAEVIEPIPA
ncbi:MAG TPA: ATP-dependent DNA helicase RecG [Solirubrobacteraceae bacterium]